MDLYGLNSVFLFRLKIYMKEDDEVPKVQDDKMVYIESDIEKIRVKSNMYIHEVGDQGSYHLGREVIQNAIDECNNPKSNGSIVRISYDKDTDVLTCEDDGRGFPEDTYKLDIYCTTLQSGSKFFRDGAKTSGEFGVNDRRQ
jgi:DNA gyrase/topoisomerase IV subunit B